MKTLKKGKKYDKVFPLPNGWISEVETAKQAERKGKYREPFRKLKKLLDDGWQFCPREEYRKNFKNPLDKSKKDGILKVRQKRNKKNLLKNDTTTYTKKSRVKRN